MWWDLVFIVTETSEVVRDAFNVKIVVFLFILGSNGHNVLIHVWKYRYIVVFIFKFPLKCIDTFWVVSILLNWAIRA